MPKTLEPSCYLKRHRPNSPLPLSLASWPPSSCRRCEVWCVPPRSAPPGSCAVAQQNTPPLETWRCRAGEGGRKKSNESTHVSQSDVPLLSLTPCPFLQGQVQTHAANIANQQGLWECTNWFTYCMYICANQWLCKRTFWHYGKSLLRLI